MLSSIKLAAYASTADIIHGTRESRAISSNVVQEPWSKRAFSRMGSVGWTRPKDLASLCSTVEEHGKLGNAPSDGATLVDQVGQLINSTS